MLFAVSLLPYYLVSLLLFCCTLSEPRNFDPVCGCTNRTVRNYERIERLYALNFDRACHNLDKDREKNYKEIAKFIITENEKFLFLYDYYYYYYYYYSTLLELRILILFYV